MTNSTPIRPHGPAGHARGGGNTTRPDLPADTLARAARQVATHAADATDCAVLLSALGLELTDARPTPATDPVNPGEAE